MRASMPSADGMDRNYIENEHIVDRYLSGDLTVREAREFEKYCLAHPEHLQELPIPVRLKTRLARRPLDHSETATFSAIPSSATRVAAQIRNQGLSGEEEETAPPSYRGNGSRWGVLALLFALVAAIGGIVVYGMHARSLSEELKLVRREMRATQMQAPGKVETYRLQLRRQRPSDPTLRLGWVIPPQLMELIIDATEGKYSTYQVTMDKVDGGRIMQVRRLARDSNNELRLQLNSSAFGPGEFLLKFEGYTWKGKPEEVGWVRLGLE
jgi:hypothetical protein